MAVRTSPALRVSERHADGGVRVIVLEGELDIDTAGIACARVDDARDDGARCVLIDLTRLRFCDSTGLRALTGAVDEALAAARRVVVVPPAEGAGARLFAVAGVSEFLPLRPTVAEGLAALAPPARE